MADLFGRQVGCKFEEGVVDSETAEEFWLRMAQIKHIWKERMGSKREEVHSWVIKYKADEMVNSMIRPVRIRAGLGDPTVQFTTNRVECINHLLSDEAGGQPQNLPQFTKIVRTLVERQRKNVEWAIIGKGPYRLHPTLQEHQVSEETWCSMTMTDERQLYIQRVFDTDISNCEVQHNQCISTLPTPPVHTTTSNNSQIQIESQTGILGLNSNEFACRLERYIHKETAVGIWKKASRLLGEPDNISVAPGCPKGSRMVASSSNARRPHLVTRGKYEGEFRCEKSCPNCCGISICSHTLAAAVHNKETKQFIDWHCMRKAKSTARFTEAVTANMPENPGKKPCAVRRKGRKASQPVIVRETRIPLDQPLQQQPLQQQPLQKQLLQQQPLQQQPLQQQPLQKQPLQEQPLQQQPLQQQPLQQQPLQQQPLQQQPLQ